MKQILVVDDEEFVTEIMKDVLEYNGYKVITSDNGAKALQLYYEKWKEIDLVISDVMMPVINGYEFFIEAKEINSNIKFIVMSCHNGPLIKEFIDNGALFFMEKPFNLSKIVNDIKNAIGG